jgi:hypothetical protein
MNICHVDLQHAQTTKTATNKTKTIQDYLCGIVYKFPLAPMRVLAPRLRTLEVSARPTIDTGGNFPVRMSAESPLNISEVISKVSEP